VIKKIVISFLLVFVSASFAFAETYVGGDITTDTTWDLAGSPYIVTSDITIRHSSSGSTATLTIQPGVVVKFQPSTGIFVGRNGYPSNYRGALNAQGSPTESITFTSNNQINDWKGIYFRPGTDDGATILDYCTIEYGGQTNNANLYFASASPTIINSTIIQNSSGYGIYCSGSSPQLTGNTISNNNIGFYCSSSSPTMDANIISDNTSYAGEITSNSFPIFTNNIFSGNSPDAINMHGDITANGTLTEPGIPYIVTSDINIQHSSSTLTATLTIQPGVVVKFQPSTGIFVGRNGYPLNYRGALNAQGTISESILFTSNAPTPAAGDWKGIYFRPGTNDGLTILDYCTVEYAGETNNANMYFNSASPVQFMNNLTISKGSGYGIYASNSSFVSHNSNIPDNNLGGINNVSANLIRAQYNWWGDSSGPSGAGPGTGQWISDYVEYDPWLGEPFSGDFYFDNISISPKTFSQNGGWMRFHLDISESANWTITIEDDIPQVVRTFSGTGTQIRQDWYGDDESLLSLPNGTYKYTISAESVASPGTTASLIGNLVLDDTLPLAKITSPELNDSVSNEVQIQGTASGADFSSYIVEYGLGQYPTSWIEVTTSSVPVEGGLLATWDATALEEPVYTIRLTVTDTSLQAVEDKVIVKLVSVYNLADSNDPFSPNADGFKDDTTISADFISDSDWQLDIKDPTEVAVRTYNGSGSSMSQVWDGKDESEVILPDADYSYQVQITETASGVSALSVIGTSTIDNTSPTAGITSPAPSELVSGTVEIIGTADDLHFESYKVDYGEGLEPGSWIPIQETTTTPVVDGILASWDVIDLSPGDYTIRLTVNDVVGNVSTYDVAVVVDNIQITNVSASPQFFEPPEGQSSAINYTLDRDAFVTIKIYDYQTSTLVRTLIDSESKTAGVNFDNWDGKDDLEALVPFEEVYAYTIEAYNVEGRHGKYDPGYVSGSVDIINPSIDPPEYDPYSGEACNINYDLVSPAWVTAKIYVGSSWVRTLITDEPRPATGNSETWDGRDDYGEIVIGDFGVRGFTQILPENSIVPRYLGLQVSYLRAEPYLILPLYNEITTIHYIISRDSEVDIKIYDPDENSFVTLQDDTEPRLAGAYSLEWDGTDGLGSYIYQAGNYRIELILTDSSNNTATRNGNIIIER